jgi:phenylpyruvate tautomerase PptA (4-oxalocrotonate tautomerase family)
MTFDKVKNSEEQNMPHIIVHLWREKSEQQKSRLAEAIVLIFHLKAVQKDSSSTMAIIAMIR